MNQGHLGKTTLSTEVDMSYEYKQFISLHLD